MTLEPCLEAIAAGDGREILQFDEERCAIVSRTVAGMCLHASVARVARLSALQMALALRSLTATRQPWGCVFSYIFDGDTLLLQLRRRGYCDRSLQRFC